MKRLLLCLFFLIPSFSHAATIEVSTPGQNIGFGSTNPGVTIDVNGTVRANHFTGIQTSDVPTLNQNTTGTAATVTTNAQPNITSVGTLTSLQVAGNVGINSTAPGKALDVKGTARADFFSGDGSNLTGISGSVSGQTTNFLPVASNATTFIPSTVNQVSGNVGVNSASPGAALDVNGSVRAAYFLGNGSLLTGISGSISGLTTNYVPKASNATTIVNGSMFDNGNVGINSTNPGYSLDVNSTIRSTQMVVVGAGAATITGDANGNVGIGSSVPGKQLDVNGSVRAGYFIGNGSLLTSLPSSQWTTINTNDVYLPNSGNVGIGTSLIGNSGGGVAALVIMNGNVGIGTWANVNKLLKITSSDATAYSNGASATVVSFNMTNTNTTDNTFSQVSFSAPDTNGADQVAAKMNAIVTSHTAGSMNADFSFVSRRSGTSTEQVRITSAGNLGIGSAAPGQTLDVVGPIRTTEWSAAATGSVACKKSDGTMGYCTGSFSGVTCTCN